MDLVELLRELRLLKGQPAYRFVLAWAAVVLHEVRDRKVIAAFVAWLAVDRGFDAHMFRVAQALIAAVGRHLA